MANSIITGLADDTSVKDDILADDPIVDDVGEEAEGKEGTEDDESKEEEGKEEKDKEIELKLDDDDDKTEDLIVPARKKEILAKYPKLFKEFPYLEKAYYRDQQFTEIFSTPSEAQETLDRATILDTFEGELTSGNISGVLTKVKENDPNSFYKIVDNYLVELGKVDQKAQFHVIGDVTKRTVASMIREADRIDNANLKAAAQILNQFMFGTAEIQDKVQPLSRESDDTVKKEREAFQAERFEIARGDLDTKISNVLKSTISEHIDPKESMTQYVKKTAIKDALESLTESIESDDRFTSQLDRLWKESSKDNFSKKSLDKIRSAYLSKAKTLLPKVISSTRNEALKGLGKKVNGEGKKTEYGTSAATNEDRGNSTGKNSPIPKGMSNRDWIMKD